MSTAEPIHDVLDRWHQHLKGRLPGGLDALLHEDCVFLSPVVFSPQRGREISKLYLSAAANVLPGDDTGAGSQEPAGTDDGHGAFRYTKRIVQGHHAMLEFETMVGDISVNGVDIITCDDDGWITEFKVMMRPYKALDAVREQMASMMDKLSAG
ncbi:MAG: nuclear transport factor 2 family protein [Actinomycetota bacterium]